MIQTLSKNWYLLALSALLTALSSAIYFILYDAGPDSTHLLGWRVEVMLLSKLLIAAGVCAIAAGVWRPEKGIPWLLVLNGLALSAYGLIPLLTRAGLSFRLFALLVAVMAMSLGFFALTVARAMRYQQHGADMWMFGASGVALLGSAFAFIALVNGWIQLERRPFHPSLFLWFCAFFGFSAVIMLTFAVMLRRLGPSQAESNEGFLLGNPKHA